MKVYADHVRRVPAPALLEELAHEIENAGFDGESRRRLLVRAGQIEQAFEDAPPEWDAPARSEILRALCAVTDDAARGAVEGSAAPALRALHAPPDLELGVRLPEGFAFYALFPEVYARAARRWAVVNTRRVAEPLLVVGVRSIGTTLSAVVAHAFRAENPLWRVRRLTVRPRGHPFDRRVNLSREEVGDAGVAVVVDEGPGLSGSSMASTATALEQAGCRVLAFFPGHAHGPGERASEETRERWRRTPVVVPVKDERAGLHLAATLGLVLEPVPDARRFARPKLREGGERPLLLKFAGFVSPDTGPSLADRLAEAACRRHVHRTGLPLLEVTHGFLCFPWVEGRVLTRHDASPSLLQRIGEHLARVAGEPLGAGEDDAACARLADVLETNAGEALGEEGRAGARRLIALAFAERRSVPHGARESGDGRPAPGEWMRAADGALIKLGGPAGAWDHTPVGRQSIAWDIAGALVEWQPDPAALLAFEQGLGETLAAHPASLRFHQAAYAALELARAGLEGESRRGDAVRYRDHLVRALDPSCLPIAS